MARLGRGQPFKPKLAPPVRSTLTNYSLSCSAGTFTLTGVAAGLRAARTLSCDAGSFTETGIAAGLRCARTISGASGAFTLTGIDAGMTYTPVGGYSLACSRGQFTLTGIDAGLRATRTISLSVGGFTMTGIAATLTYSGAAADTIDAPPRFPAAAVLAGIGHKSAVNAGIAQRVSCQ
jgi:hypothetical protein